MCASYLGRPYLAAIILLGAVLGGASSRAEAKIGSYRLAILHVTYTDTTPLYTASQMQQAGAELTQHFKNISFGQLTLEVATVEVALPNSTTYYTGCVRTATHQCPNLTIDAASVAAAGNFSFAGVNGISVVSTYCARNFTYPPIHIVGNNINGTFNQSHDYECHGYPSGPSGVTWGAWAHELGHQIEWTNYGGDAFNWGSGGHPSGYKSGYELMDSCYPCADSAFSLLKAPLVNGDKHVFGDWLNAHNVAIVNAPSPGTTIVLTPLELGFTETQANQAIQVPISPGVYYLVEVRKRLLSDTLVNHDIPPNGIYDEGVLISEVEEMRDPPVKPVNSCDTTSAGGCIYSKTDPRYATCNWTTRPSICWPFALWHTGETFTDAERGVTITVQAAVGDGFAVTVGRGVVPGHPNMFIVPWLTPPMNTYETEDVWVDSSCNGYEADVGPSGLLFGRRADGTVIGNGDEPCANHENRIYATVHNIGDKVANNVVVRFQVSSPLGVGMTDSWSVVGNATIPSLGPGASTTVYTTWTPSVNLTAGDIAARHFAFHSCVQVIIQPVTGEILTSDNNAQENFDNFAAVQTLQEHYTPIQGSFFIHRPTEITSPQYCSPFGYCPPQTYYLDIKSELPAGWRYQVAGGQSTVTIAQPGQTQEVPVEILVPPGAEVGRSYNLAVRAFAQVSLQNDAIPPSADVDSVHFATAQVGAVVLAARPVRSSLLSLTARALPTGQIVATGRLRPGMSKWIAVDFADRTKTYTRLARSDQGGNFSCVLPSWLIRTSWQVRAIWQGDRKYEGAVTAPISVFTGLADPHARVGPLVARCHSYAGT